MLISARALEVKRSGVSWAAFILVICVSLACGQALAQKGAAVYQPDLKIALKGGSYVGDDVYAETGGTQTVQGEGSTRAVIEYWIAIQNDGTVADRFVLIQRSTGTHDKWIRRYYDEKEEGQEITAVVRGPGWTTGLLTPGQEKIIRMCIVPGAEVETLSTELVATSTLTKGDLNITPEFFDADLRLELETPYGLIDVTTLHDNGAGYTYTGPATVLRITPKAQGRTLQHDGHTLELDPSVRYTLTSGTMTVGLRNLQPDAKDWNQAKGHWWIEVAGTSAALDPNPLGPGTDRFDAVGIMTRKLSGGSGVRVRVWRETE